MAGQLIVAPQYADVKGPVIFLAGPIQGAADWQQEAIKAIRALSDVHIANPRRPAKEYSNLMTEEQRVAQYDWETHYLRRAGLDGCVMFWLAKEAEHKCDRAYAQTTRFELAEWKLRHERDGIRLVVGIEKGFTGERYIRRRFLQDCPDIYWLCDTLPVTCHAALQSVYGA